MPVWGLQARLQLCIPGKPLPPFHVKSWIKIMNTFIVAEAQFAMTSYAYLYLPCTSLFHASDTGPAGLQLAVYTAPQAWLYMLLIYI